MPANCLLWTRLSDDEKALLDTEAGRDGYTDTIQWLVDKYCQPGTDQVMRTYLTNEVTKCHHLIDHVSPAVLLEAERILESEPL